MEKQEIQYEIFRLKNLGILIYKKHGDFIDKEIEYWRSKLEAADDGRSGKGIKQKFDMKFKNTTPEDLDGLLGILGRQK
ncbi:MAG: hypothetical protein NUV65_03585 [Candidatus Roizmanbacteria bacterium]|nr:hypothetical protein [Candidatus Roizmanbacteria bacterium]